MDKAIQQLFENILSDKVLAVQGFKSPDGKFIGFLTPGQLAQLLQVSVKTLERMRKNNDGPSYMKDGSKRIRYPIAELYDWLNGKTINPSSQC